MRERERQSTRNEIINVSLDKVGGKGKLEDMMFCYLFFF